MHHDKHVAVAVVLQRPPLLRNGAKHRPYFGDYQELLLKLPFCVVGKHRKAMSLRNMRMICLIIRCLAVFYNA